MPSLRFDPPICIYSYSACVWFFCGNQNHFRRNCSAFYKNADITQPAPSNNTLVYSFEFLFPHTLIFFFFFLFANKSNQLEWGPKKGVWRFLSDGRKTIELRSIFAVFRIRKSVMKTMTKSCKYASTTSSFLFDYNLNNAEFKKKNVRRRLRDISRTFFDV